MDNNSTENARKQTMTRCPYCHNRVILSLWKKGNKIIYSCPECSSAIHRDLVEKRYLPRMTIGIVGYSGHGKTVFLTSLFSQLHNLVQTRTWPNGFHYSLLDDISNESFFTGVTSLEKSNLSAGTPQNFSKPCFLKFN